MDEEFMRGYYDAYNSGDPALLGAFLADDVVMVSAQGESRGKDAYLATYKAITAAFVDQMTPTAITVDGDTATVRITDRFTAKTDVPDFLGQSYAKGQGFTLQLLARYRAQGKKIAHIEVEITGMSGNGS